MFRGIASDNFPPFGKMLLELPPVENKPDDLAEVHLFTGVNGTGKTRLLSVLAAFLDEPGSLLRRLKAKDSVEINATELISSFKLPNPNEWDMAIVAKEGKLSDKGYRKYPQFAHWCRNVPAFAYSGVAYVSDIRINDFNPVPKPDRISCLAFVRPEEHSKALLQAIANLKIQSALDSQNATPGSSETSRATRLMAELETAISRITGQKFSFKVNAHPTPNLLINWAGAELPFNSLPDGLRSIIGWLVHVVVMLDLWTPGMSDSKTTEAVILLDEIESTLHPAWQRRILPAFQRLLPKAQIFVATHSPFAIASLNHGWIHPISMDDKGKVTIEKPRAASAGDSYVSVVEDIMGLKEWFDPETESLLAQFRNLRDDGYKGVAAAQGKARELATTIGKRSVELNYTMSRELHQMDRQLAGVGASK